MQLAFAPALLLLVLSFPLFAQDGADLHAFWDDRCRICHQHSGEFARRHLRIVDGRLAGVHHRDDLETFLRNHYLGDEWLAPITAMLAAQLATEALFGSHCARCHGHAADFARTALVVRDGVPTGRTSGTPVAETLRVHGGLPSDQASVVVDSLARVLGELQGSTRQRR